MDILDIIVIVLVMVIFFYLYHHNYNKEMEKRGREIHKKMDEARKILLENDCVPIPENIFTIVKYLLHNKRKNVGILYAKKIKSLEDCDMSPIIRR